MCMTFFVWQLLVLCHSFIFLKTAQCQSQTGTDHSDAYGCSEGWPYSHQIVNLTSEGIHAGGKNSDFLQYQLIPANTQWTGHREISLLPSSAWCCFRAAPIYLLPWSRITASVVASITSLWKSCKHLRASATRLDELKKRRYLAKAVSL